MIPVKPSPQKNKDEHKQNETDQYDSSLSKNQQIEIESDSEDDILLNYIHSNKTQSSKTSSTEEKIKTIYNDDEIRREYIKKCKKESNNYFGIDLNEVYEMFKPFPLHELIKRFDEKVLHSRTSEEIENIRNKSVPTNHLNNSHGVKSVLRQFCRFLRDNEKKPKLKHFVDVSKVLGYFRFRDEFTIAASTKRNNAQAFISILEWFRSRDEFKEYIPKIEFLQRHLREYAEINKHLANRTRQTKSESERIADGNWFAPGEEDAFVIWAINFWMDIVKNYVDETGKVEPIELDDCWELMDCLIALTGLLNGGLRREVNANIDPTKIVYENGYLSFETTKEKRVRLNVNSLPFPTWLSNFIIFYIENVIPVFKKLNPKKEVKCLWYNRKGNPLEHKDYSKHFTRFISRFNPDLKITPIETRRQGITNLFGNRIESSKDHRELVRMAERYFNVGNSVMEKYYNRYNYYSQLLEIQTLMVKSMISEDTQNYISQINEYLQKLVGYKSNITNKNEKEIKLLVRLTPYDDKWNEYLLLKKKRSFISPQKRKSPRKKKKVIDLTEKDPSLVFKSSDNIEKEEIDINQQLNSFDINNQAEFYESRFDENNFSLELSFEGSPINNSDSESENENKQSKYTKSKTIVSIDSDEFDDSSQKKYNHQ